MQPDQYLQQVSIDFDLLNSCEGIDAVLGGFEFVFNTLVLELQNLAADLFSRLKQKLAVVK